jgi:hypothetical protein
MGFMGAPQAGEGDYGSMTAGDHLDFFLHIARPPPVRYNEAAE